MTRETRAAARRPRLPSDPLLRRRSAIEIMFDPKSVALIGATETPGSVGLSLLRNLAQGAFRGAVYPVHPHRKKVLGLPAFKTVGAVPATVELAVIATPAATIPEVVRECSEAGVRGAIIISAGFKEIGPAGQELERQISEARGPMRILGPNCLGAMFPHSGLNATFAAGLARPGSVGFISQSGALCTAVLDWSLRENVGFSAFLSVGSMTDLGWGDLIYHLGDDPRTRSIVIYMESIGNARAFLSAAREVALTKPIIVLKVGRSAAAARAAASHTGSLVGDDDVLDAAFRRAGVVRVHTIAELFAMAEAFGKQPRPAGPHLAIVTNAGGPAGLATDALLEAGGQLAELTTGSVSALQEILPAHWSHGNPIDLLGEATPEQFARAVEMAANDPNTNGTLVILTPQAMTDPTGTAERLRALALREKKPLLASWMGAASVETGEQILNAAGVATFRHPDTAARVFANMWRSTYDLRGLYETPTPSPRSHESGSPMTRAERVVSAARKAGRSLLDGIESMQVLEAYGLPVARTLVAHSEAEAVAAAGSIGYPVVLKLHSRTITHKAEVGGVKLRLGDAQQVRRAYRAIEAAVQAPNFRGVTVAPMVSGDGYEIIVGSSFDPQFGPVLLFGAGGGLVEVWRDRSLGLPPLTATLARRIMERTRIYEALRGQRGQPPIDCAALEQLFVRFSHLVTEQRFIKEIDINPLFVTSERMVALDARIVLHAAAKTEDQLPKVAIRPYPTQYISRWKTKSGESVLIRPIRPEDEPAMAAFHQTLSERSVHFRYFALLKLDQRVEHARLSRICFNDYDRELALVVEHRRLGAREIVAVGRLCRSHGLNEAEFALVVGDAWQGHGLGTQLLTRLVDAGRQEKLERIVAHILPDNAEMLRLCRKLHFTLRRDAEAPEVCAELILKSAAAQS